MINFTKQERFIIAEFVYSYASDILIISDATRLINVLSDHNLISDKNNWHKKVFEKDLTVCGDLHHTILEKISPEQGLEIMNEYYGKTN